MALPLPSGLVPTEVAFLCEMEMVTIVPRRKLWPISLLSGETPALQPPRRAQLPLWLAILLKKQGRANIVAPAWLRTESLQHIIREETDINPLAFSPPPPPVMRSDGRGVARPYAHSSKPGDLVLSSPFLSSCTADAPQGHLPYHWLELAETLLAHAADDIPSTAEVRTLLRDLQEARAAKMRLSSTQLEGGGGVLSLTGVGAMELAESRGFVLGVMEGVRKLGASAEGARREAEEAREGDEDSDEEMGFE